MLVYVCLKRKSFLDVDCNIQFFNMYSFYVLVWLVETVRDFTMYISQGIGKELLSKLYIKPYPIATHQ